MMIRHVLTALVANAASLLAAAFLVAGFELDVNNLVAFGALVGVFTAITLVIRPIIKFVLSPIIVLTFGLFNLVINAGLLMIVDKYSEHLTINGLVPLVYGTLIITIINVIINFVFHRPTVH
jgi:putative membrane protein